MSAPAPAADDVRRQRRRLLVAVAAALVVALALGVGIGALLSRGGDGKAGPSPGGTTSTPKHGGKKHGGHQGGKKHGPQVSPTGDTSTTVQRVRQRTEPIPAPDGVRRPLGPAPGFAGAVTGGSGGRAYHVTTAADAAQDPPRGSLRWALAQRGPRWIVFDRDLTVRLRAPLAVPSDTTIDGRGQRVELTGHGLAGLQVHDARNVIVENLTLHDFGDTALTKSNNPDDALEVRRSELVWIDHNTLSEAGDKLVALGDGTVGVTVSWNHFLDQEQVLQIGSLSTAQNDVRSTVTIVDNWFDHVGYRLPLAYFAKVHVVNNVMDDWSVSAVRSTAMAQTYLQDNVFLAGSNPRAGLVRPAQRCNDKGTLCNDRDGFLYSTGNQIVGKGFIRDSGPDHVFDPTQAYDLPVRPADSSLRALVTAQAGAR